MNGTDAASPRLRNYTLVGALLAGLIALAAVIMATAGSSSGGGSVASVVTHHHSVAVATARPSRTAPVVVAPKEAVTRHPVTRAAAAAPATAVGKRASLVSSTPGHRVFAAEQPDPEAALSAPAPASVHHAAAKSPSAAAMIAPGAPSDAQVRAELRAMNAAVAAEQSSSASGGAIALDGTVQVPAGVPAVIARVIAGANAITDFPYVYGGGHASFVDDAYDCSGSVSYALAAGGLLGAPETSGQLESWGAAGPGRWISIYANAGHVYMFIDGLRYDTAGRTGVFSTRWQTGPDPVAGPNNGGFIVRHYPGL